MYQKRKTIENLLVLMLDILCLTISLGLAFGIRYGKLYGVYEHGDQQWILIFILLFFVVVSFLFDSYKHFFRRNAFTEFKSIIQSEVILLLVVLAMLYVMHRSNELSRLVLGFFAMINTILMYAAHLLFKQIMLRGYRKSKYSSRLLVVADSGNIQRVLSSVTSYNEWYRQIVGIALTDTTNITQVEGIAVVADAATLLDYVIHNDIDEVFIIDGNMRQNPLFETWIREMSQMGIIVDVNIDAFDITYTGKKTLNRVGKYAVVTFARNLFSARQVFAKRMLDILGSLVGMVILVVATLFVAPAIKLDSPGPVFFGQVRVGKNGRKFTFYKFRSMYVDAEERKKELMAQNEVKGLMFKMEDDPRITRVGKFLRRTSIDELPQFLNVLRGDMSLVGTRPPTMDEFAHYEAKHKCRLSMTPGLTGLWQVSGRSDIKDFDEVVRMDMEYIDNWTIWKDIKILLLTVKVVFTGKGSK